METVKLSTIIKYIYPELEQLLTVKELEMPIILKDGMDSINSDEILEIIEASISILLKKKGALLH